MAKAKDFDGTANETDVVILDNIKAKGKRKGSILGEKSRLWLLTVNNPQLHGFSSEQKDVLNIIKEEIAQKKITYVACVMEQSLSVDENGEHTPHAHIALYWPGQAFGGRLHSLFPMAALQNCDANIVSLRQYLLKDPTGKWYESHPEKFGEKLPFEEANFWEWGVLPDGKRKGANISAQQTFSEAIVQAIRDGKNDSEIVTMFPSVWYRSSEFRKIRFAIMNERYRTIYRKLSCIYIEANLPPEAIHKLFPCSKDTYVVSDYSHPWDSYCAEKTVVFVDYLGQFAWYDIKKYLSGNYCTLSARFSDAVACYENIIIISPLSFVDMCLQNKTYIPDVLSRYITHYRCYQDIEDMGADYIRDSTGRWIRQFLLPPAHDEKEKSSGSDKLPTTTNKETESAA